MCDRLPFGCFCALKQGDFGKMFFFRSELCFWGLEGYNKNLPVVPLFIDFFRRRRKNLLSIEIMQYVCSKVHKYDKNQRLTS